MDHNLEDSLTMESIENMDFDHSGVVVNQEDITLEEGVQAGDMPMDLDTIEEQPALLNAGSEEVIVSDFIGEQFGFQEYSMQGENSSGANITIEANQLSEMTGQNEQIVNLQYNDCVNKASTSQSNVITIKAIPQHRGGKKVQPTAALPRQVAIAPKPTKGASNVQYAIAPKPVALVMNKNANLSKTVHMKNVVQGLKGNTVLAQIGKQLVMVPAGSAGQKIKLSNISSTDGNIQFLRCSSDSAQLIANKGGAKQMRTKFIVHGQSHSDPSNQPAVITKLVPVSTASQARYVMQQKTVPISIGGNKVVLTTPPKQAVKVAPKKPMIAIKTQSPKVVTSQPNIQTQKVVITANPTPTLKSAATKTQVQIVKDNTTGQRTQLHPINVPGKGIQYIKLVTNQPPTPKPAPKPTLAMSGKNFLLTDSKGNILQMTAEKVMSSQPPPLLVTTATTSGSSKVPPKLTKKLVRIAPVSHKADMPSAKVREASKIAHCLQSTAVPTSRAPQSLLAPRAAAPAGSSLLEFSDLAERSERSAPATSAGDTGTDTGGARDVKPTLASLISDAVGEDESVPEINSMEEVEIEYENTSRKQEHFTEDENTNSMEHESSNERLEESVIVVPSNVPDFNTSQDEEDMYHDDTDMSMEDHSRNVQLNIDADVMAHLSPQRDQSFSDSVLMYDGKPESAAGPGLRPRKACNCTKSQCLKLYCDCFANGEFCNKCNCNNCHNNLENEELRQKAIRACLERNPNAFRPKIGKSKAGGPEIIRRHNKGCNCKRSGCLKNYCECYEAKIACTLMCKCVGCRNIEETLERRRDALRLRDKLTGPTYRPPLPLGQMKQPCSFMTPEVIEAVAQCMLATVGDAAAGARAEPGALAEPGARGPRPEGAPPDPVEDILLEFSRCMADIISASHQAL